MAKKFGTLQSQKQDRGRSSPSRGTRGALLLFNAAVGSGALVFAPLCLRMGDKMAHDGMPDMSLLSPPAIKRPASSAAEESRRQVVGFAEAAARAAAMVPAAPALGLRSQSLHQQQQSRKGQRCHGQCCCITNSLLPSIKSVAPKVSLLL